MRSDVVFFLAAAVLLPLPAVAGDDDAVAVDAVRGTLQASGPCDAPVVIIAYYAGTDRIWGSGDAPCRGEQYQWEIAPGEWQMESADLEVEVIRDGYERHGTRYPVTITQAEALLDTPPPQAEAPAEPEEDPEEEAQQEDEGEANTDGFWARILSAIIEWLENSVVRIKEIVAERLTAPTLCLGETCITESHLKELLKEALTEPEPSSPESAEESAPEDPPVDLVSIDEEAGEAELTVELSE